jgi:hypothetical protein
MAIVCHGEEAMSEESFHRVISEHLALAERNKRLPRSAQEEPSTEPNVAASRREPHSWWDASEERALPEFEWGDN